MPDWMSTTHASAEHNTDMLIYAAIQGGEGAVARKWANIIRTHQQALHTAAYGDSSRSWTHLPLVQARSTLMLPDHIDNRCGHGRCTGYSISKPAISTLCLCLLYCIHIQQGQRHHNIAWV